MAIQKHAHRSQGPSPASRTSRPRPPAAEVACALVVGATAVVTWLASGVSAGEIGRFLVFEGLYVLLPACSLYLLLGRSFPRPLRVVAIGWPLGYAIEIGAFALTAALGDREVFRLLPLFAAAIAWPLIARLYGGENWLRVRRATEKLMDWRRAQHGSLPVVALGVVIGLAMVVLALRFFVPYPLPGHAHSVAYLP